jgi:hypothetical protein
MIVVKCSVKTRKKGVERTCDRFLAKILKEEMMKQGFQIHLKCPSCGNYAIITKGMSDNINIIHIKEGEGELCKKNLKI